MGTNQDQRVRDEVRRIRTENRRKPLTRKVRSGLRMMAELARSWRETDGDESLDRETISEIEAANAWLNSLPRARASPALVLRWRGPSHELQQR